MLKPKGNVEGSMMHLSSRALWGQLYLCRMFEWCKMWTRRWYIVFNLCSKTNATCPRATWLENEIVPKVHIMEDIFKMVHHKSIFLHWVMFNIPINALSFAWNTQSWFASRPYQRSVPWIQDLRLSSQPLHRFMVVRSW